MIKKKNKVAAFLCSLLPGAGEMYLGFFKMGISLMVLFFGFFSIAGFLRMELFIFITPVFWFYSFFHTNHINSLPDDEFYTLEDHFLFSSNLFPDGINMVKKHHKIFALLLVFFGVGVIWNSASDLMFHYIFPYWGLDENFQYVMMRIMDSIPQIIVAVGLIVAGGMMIKEKKEELDNDSL